jgi:hypothetical protein
MLLIENLGHSSAVQCIELVKNFGRIEDPAVRGKVLELMEELADETGELLSLDEFVAATQDI